MITKEDILDKGFKIECEANPIDLRIILEKNEIPQELYERFDECHGSKSYYEIDGKKYIVTQFTIRGDKEYIDIVRMDVVGERIVYKKGKLLLYTEWYEGNLRHAYQTNCNTFYGWNTWNPNGTIDDLLHSCLEEYRKKQRDGIAAYKRKIRELEERHKREFREYNGLIKELEEALK